MRKAAKKELLEESQSPLLEQSKEDAKKENDEYKKLVDTLWIEKFFHNNNYHIVDNEGGGECLFAVIRDGLARIGIKKSVNEMRTELAKEATEEIFKNYKEQYEMYKKIS